MTDIMLWRNMLASWVRPMDVQHTRKLKKVWNGTVFVWHSGETRGGGGGGGGGVWWCGGIGAEVWGSGWKRGAVKVQKGEKGE